MENIIKQMKQRKKKLDIKGKHENRRRRKPWKNEALQLFIKVGDSSLKVTGMGNKNKNTRCF